jgi:hypothetical protein
MTPRIHAFLLALLAVGVGLLFMEEPQFGDDFTYWSFGFNTHEHGFSSIPKGGFHLLRWPVWGLCWLAQGIFGYGLVSYYFAPFLVLVLGAWCAFAMGWHFFKKAGPAWACGIIFLFHPLLDANLTRPYPDIGEGVIGAGAVFCWWALMHAQTRWRILLAALGCGAALFVGEENRLTGFFFYILLWCLTLLFFRRKFLRMFLPTVVFGLLLFGQMAFYHAQYGKWLHFIDANRSGTGRPGTEAGLALWEVPFRFLDNLVKGSDIMPFFAVFAAIGLWFAWRQHGLAGRVVVAWFVLLYLAYACAPQKLYPFRPVLRDAGRFLSSLAIPYSVLIVFGLLGTLQWLAAAPRTRRFAEFVRRHPVWFSLAGVAVLAVSSFAGDRRFFTLGYVPELRAYMRALPADAVIFTHRQAYILAHLVDAPTAERLHWRASDKWIVDADPQSIADEAAATDFWYVRKLAMMKFSKDISTEDPKKKLTKQPPLAPWFDTPELHWRLAAVMARSDTPDIILYKRRTASDPPPLTLTPESPELSGLLPHLPFAWKQEEGARDFHKDALQFDWIVPPILRGKLIRLEMEASSEEREAFTVGVTFRIGGVDQPAYLMKPYFFRDGGKEFACLPVPANAENCQIRVRFAKGTEWVKVTSFRLFAD